MTVDRPRPPANGGGVPAGGRLNLFLYETSFDPTLRNVPLEDGRPAPLWLVLKYLLTAFRTGGTAAVFVYSVEEMLSALEDAANFGGEEPKINDFLQHPINNLVDHMVAPNAASFITGEARYVDGGYTAMTI